MGEPVDIICLDFQEVFDVVTHQRLLRKLYSQGISGRSSYGSIIGWAPRNRDWVSMGNFYHSHRNESTVHKQEIWR